MIQIFRLTEPDSNVGQWHNTAWGNDDLAKTKKIAREIAESNKMNIVKVRVLEVVEEINIKQGK